ncbi:hypothetical protein HYALB_00010483 [Hymenoscyphus albidus]|uniref:Uncharacterized protein n=1 Tax=Hymenoscyphus albidus TaxID=595503 RepID=A0A9N9LTQ5_9HELO|nr:hypothetical protein HYALB_00010483 [Hymenoscyphus albidus]
MLVPNIFAATAVLCTFVSGIPLEEYNKATVPPLGTATGADGVSTEVVPEPVYLRTYNTATNPPLRTAMEPDQVAVVPLSQKKHNEPIIQESKIRWEPDDEVIQKRGPGFGKPSSPVPGKPATKKPKTKFRFPWSRKPVHNPRTPPKPRNWENPKHEF